MTVGELIAILANYDENAIVTIDCYDEVYNEESEHLWIDGVEVIHNGCSCLPEHRLQAV